MFNILCVKIPIWNFYFKTADSTARMESSDRASEVLFFSLGSVLT